MRNVVWITIDECKATALSTYGNRFVHTPAAEHMQAYGTQFDRAFTCHPKCVPSRCCMLSGRYSHSEGHRTLPGFELRKNEWNLASHLRDKGFVTAMIGNNHTVEPDILRDVFDEIPGNPRFAKSLLDIDASCMPVDDPTWRSFYRGPWQTANDWPHSDVHDVAAAKDFLQRQNDNPFFLLVNLGMPHPNYQDMEDYIGQIEALNPPLPPKETLAEAPETLKQYRMAYDLEHLGEQGWKKVQNAYFSMVCFVDNLVKGLLDEIDRLGLSDDTLVIYTSDHGDFAGEHGCTEKYDTMFYDCLVHIPLWFKGKGILAGQKLEGLVENIDFAPTILDALDMQIPAQIHGRSLWPALTRGCEDGRKYVFCEGGVEGNAIDRAPHYDLPECIRMKPDYYWKQKAALDYRPSSQRSKMIRSKDWKLVYRLDGTRELYNLNADPGELKDVARDIANNPVIWEMMEALLRWCIRTETEYPLIESYFA